jgi:hypothetical protein
MDWETIAPRSGQRTKPGGVSVGWRKVSANHFRAVLTLSREALERLGTTAPTKGAAKVRLLVQRSRSTHQLRLTVSDAPEAWAMHSKDGCATIAVALDEVTLATRQPARPVEHLFDGRALILTLPTWAHPPRPAIPLVEPQAAPKPAPRPSRHTAVAMNTPTRRDADPNCPLLKLPPEDLAEAREMMRSSSVGATALAEYFGWEHAQAVRIAAAIRDEMALARGAAA